MSDPVDYIAKARRWIGPKNLAVAIAMEAHHRATGMPKIAIMAMYLGHQMQEILVVDRAAELKAIDDRAEMTKKYEAAVSDLERKEKARKRRELRAKSKKGNR